MIIVKRPDTVIEPELSDPLANDARDQMLAAEFGEILASHYPRHQWFVHVDSRPHVGMVYIYNGLIDMGSGYRLHLGRVLADPKRKAIMRAGGEMLERANLDRGTWKGDSPEYVEGVPVLRQYLWKKLPELLIAQKTQQPLRLRSRDC